MSDLLNLDSAVRNLNNNFQGVKFSYDEKALTLKIDDEKASDFIAWAYERFAVKTKQGEFVFDEAWAGELYCA